MSSCLPSLPPSLLSSPLLSSRLLLKVAHPYDEFTKAGYTMTWASPKGGVAPVDEGSITASEADPSCMSFIKGAATKALVDNTIPLSCITNLSPFDAIFFAGGFGTMWE
jgi:putative intracellular protease/amidase